ncbi:MAG: cytochrome c [Gammaproteobacteria bacterium]|nr:cytochrome c [Gammaproteobacteria bacterium]
MTRFGADAPVTGSGASPACTARVFGPLSLIRHGPALRGVIISARLTLPAAVPTIRAMKRSDRMHRIVSGMGGLLLACLVASDGVAAEPDAASHARSVKDGVYTEAQALRGEAAYRAHCIECHGEDLRGGHMTPSMVGIGFAFRWRNRDLHDFYEGMRATMPQSAPGGLSADVYADLVAFILARNGYPAGDAELPSETDSSRGIVIEAEF